MINGFSWSANIMASPFKVGRGDKLDNFDFIFFLFLKHWRVTNNRLNGRGVSSELISKFLSSMILHNHSSYIKSAEMNSCRLSPLPTYGALH